MKTIVLNKTGYDPFIDFLKGASIIGVILTHTITPQFHQWSLFCLWGDLAVPLFLLIQVFHASKRGIRNYRIRGGQLLRRIILPFAIAQLVIVLLMWGVKSPFDDVFFRTMIASFGTQGAGAYYPYIYLQMALLLLIPRMLPANFHPSAKALIVVGILVSTLAEVITCLSGCQPDVYRYIAVRYIFLLFLGWIITRQGIQMNWLTLVLSIISVVAILVFNYTTTDFTPWFWSNNWRIFHWISYFYVAWILIYLLHKCYERFPIKLIKSYFVKAGKYSYEIFLFQMVYFTISPCHIIASKYLPSSALPLVYVIDALLCTLPVIWIKQLKQIKTR